MIKDREMEVERLRMASEQSQLSSKPDTPRDDRKAKIKIGTAGQGMDAQEVANEFLLAQFGRGSDLGIDIKHLIVQE